MAGLYEVTIITVEGLGLITGTRLPQDSPTTDGLRKLAFPSFQWCEEWKWTFCAVECVLRSLTELIKFLGQRNGMSLFCHAVVKNKW